MVDMGRKMSAIESVPTKNQKSYPSISMDMTKMKELKDCEIGDTVMILAECKITGKNEYGNNEKICNLDIMRAEITENGEKSDDKDEAGDE